MKLVSKRNVFLSSADKASGDRGNFTIQVPGPMVFDENMVFKIFLSQINMRNTFFFVTARNCQYFIQFTAAGAAAPAVPTKFDGLPWFLNNWVPLTLPYGFPSDEVVAACVNEQLLQAVNGSGGMLLNCVYRNGRLYFVQRNTTQGTALMNDIYIWFNNNYDAYGNEITGPCHHALGFPQKNVSYKIVPDVVNPNDARVNGADGASFNPSEAAMSPVLMDIDHMSDIIIRTTLPSDNFNLTEDGPEMSGVTVQIPIIVPPGGNIVYADEIGINAVYEKSRSVVTTLDVDVLDKNLDSITPGHDWSIVMCIEQYEDVDAQTLKSLSQQTANDDEIIQLLKMLLLQREFKPAK